MDRQTVEHHLALAEGHVAEGRRHIEDQRRLVAELERDGHESGAARRLLATFEETQRLHVEDRERIANELAALENGRRRSVG